MKLCLLMIGLFASSTQSEAQMPRSLQIGKCGLYSLGLTEDEAGKVAADLGCRLRVLTGSLDSVYGPDGKIEGGVIFVLGKAAGISRPLMRAADLPPAEVVGVILRSLTNLGCDSFQGRVTKGGFSSEIGVRRLEFHCRDRHIDVEVTVRSDERGDRFESPALSEKVDAMVGQ